MCALLKTKMCPNSLLENEQIEKFIENGMPSKIINTIKYTMRKRVTNKAISNQEPQIDKNLNLYNNSNTQEINAPNSNPFPSKCPFGYGKSTTSEGTFYLTPITPGSTISNNNVYEQFPQISKLSPTIKPSTATNDGGNHITNLSDHQSDDCEQFLLSTKNIYNDDVLAKGTQFTKHSLRSLRSSKFYILLTKTTQSAHLLAIGIVSFVLLSVWPALVDRNGISMQRSEIQQSVPTQEVSVRKNDMLGMVGYLGAFSIHFGAQIWMTFVSGLSLYFSLPRHLFGQCQQILFPKYFTMNAALSIAMLILYLRFFIKTWTLAKYVQVGSLTLTSAIELLVRLYLAPPLLTLMQEKYKIEGTIGSGKEIGVLVQGDLVKCPHYQRIHRAFRRLHMTVAIGNIITMAGSCLQLYNIAGQLQISLV